MPADWLIWQLIDSAFPAGGFAHSGGLEAMWQSGHVRQENLIPFLEEMLAQNAAALCPFLAEAWKRPEAFVEIDAACDAFITGHVANRASRAQGQALLSSAMRIFNSAPITAIETQVRQSALAGHFPVVFGAVCRHLELTNDQTLRAFLFVSLRGLISAAVRLGIVGPMRGQQIQTALSDRLEKLVLQSQNLTMADAAQINPLLELVANTSDRLYSRLFQS